MTQQAAKGKRKRKAAWVIPGVLAGLALLVFLLVPAGLLWAKGETCASLGDVYADLGHVLTLRENHRWDGGGSLNALGTYLFSHRYDCLLRDWRQLEEELDAPPDGMTLLSRTLYLSGEGGIGDEDGAYAGPGAGLRIFYEDNSRPEDWAFSILELRNRPIYQKTDGEARRVGDTFALTRRSNPKMNWIREQKEETLAQGALWGQWDSSGRLTQEGRRCLEEAQAGYGSSGNDLCFTAYSGEALIFPNDQRISLADMEGDGGEVGAKILLDGEPVGSVWWRTSLEPLTQETFLHPDRTGLGWFPGVHTLLDDSWQYSLNDGWECWLYQLRNDPSTPDQPDQAEGTIYSALIGRPDETDVFLVTIQCYKDSPQGPEPLDEGDPGYLSLEQMQEIAQELQCK